MFGYHQVVVLDVNSLDLSCLVWAVCKSVFSDLPMTWSWHYWFIPSTWHWSTIKCYLSSGVTINDLVTGCLAGAVRRYIQSMQGECNEDVQIAVSINTRPPSMLLNENLPLENNSTGVILNLPVTGGSVLDRIEQSKKRMDVIKNSSDFLVFGFIFNHVLANLPDFLARFSVNSLNRHCCLIMSNVPGPLNQMVIGGDEVESIMVWPPLIGGTGMSTAIFSYAGTLRLNIKADTSVFPNPKLLADYFQMEIDELFALFLKKDE